MLPDLYDHQAKMIEAIPPPPPTPNPWGESLQVSSNSSTDRKPSSSKGKVLLTKASLTNRLSLHMVTLSHSKRAIDAGSKSCNTHVMTPTCAKKYMGQSIEMLRAMSSLADSEFA